MAKSENKDTPNHRQRSGVQPATSRLLKTSQDPSLGNVKSEDLMDRRTFLKTSTLVGGGLMLGFTLPAQAANLVGLAKPLPGNNEVAVTAWVRITPDNQVTLIVSQTEMGQGISTTLPAILADELGADWAHVRLETAPFASTATAYRNPKWHWMFTGNSESIQNFYALMRKTGAAAREMLTRVAAKRWNVSPESCLTKKSTIIHTTSGRKYSFGDLASDAAKLPVPEKPLLKSKNDLHLVGKALPKVDIPSKVDGSATFGIDFKVPGMMIAAVRTSPIIGGTLKSFNEAAVRSKPGVHHVVQLTNGVAVVADTYWQARSALEEAMIEFDPGPNSGLDSTTLTAKYRAVLKDGPWVMPVTKGRADVVFKSAKQTFTYEYETPFAAHATMEPMNCTASVTADKCEIWAPTQGQELAFHTLKKALGMDDDKIVVNRTPYVGGGFGRRLLPDFVVQAALISKSVGRPIKLIWDREEDMRRDSYRPAVMVRISAATSGKGLPDALSAWVVSPTILLPIFPVVKATIDKTGFDPSALEGMLETDYEIPNREVRFHLFKTVIPTSVMRTTGYGPNIFAFESFIDELAHAAKADPYHYRRSMLRHNARAQAVLDRAARLSHWGKPLPKGMGRGIAYTFAFGTYFAQVIEVEVKGQALRVRQVTSVADCGRTMDPRIAASNIEGGVVFGLAFCIAAITFKGGQAEQDNFDSYKLPYLSETPNMITEFIDGEDPLGGIGEVSPVTVAPALVNAIFAASGRRLRSLPIGRHGFYIA